MPFLSFTPVVKSNVYGDESFGEKYTIEEALATLKRIKAQANDLGDDDRIYTVECNYKGEEE
jgi:hypothetical protein